MAFDTFNPASGTLLRTYERTPRDQVQAILRASHKAHVSWRLRTTAGRADLMRAAAFLLRRDVDALSVLMAEEMGKPIKDGRGEVEKCAWVCEHYADHAAAYLAQESIATDAAESFVAFEPLGPVLAVMPWNFPLWQVFRFAAPALIAGNTALLKHASNVPGCALAIEALLHEAGIPRDVFRTLLVPGSAVADLIGAPEVAAVTLTGSTPAGRSVGAAAGKALKPSVLELGGSDPYVVLADADVEAAAEACVAGRLVNSGQSCIAAKRLIVVPEVREAFEAAIVHAMGRRRMGDPLDATTDIGPQARADLRDELHGQVEASVAAGARLLLGGTIPDRPGAWYPPTVLTDVAAGMPAYDEELFGPVAAILPVADEAEALRVANDTPFGLGAAVFTGDVARGRELATKYLHAGACFVNTFVRSDPRLPFGGIKQSGYGRELAREGIRAFVNVKTIYVA